MSSPPSLTRETSSSSSLSSILGTRTANNNERNVRLRNSLHSSAFTSTNTTSTSLLPIDQSLVTHAMNIRTNMITIETLMKEDQNKIPW